MAVLGALSMHLEITAVVLITADERTSDTHHPHLRGSYILAMVTHNLDIIDLCW
jgi:hypothetical protein